MADIEGIRLDIVANSEELADSVVSAWRDICGREDWLSLPDDVDLDFLPETIEGMANAALSDEHDEVAGRQELLEAAARHGHDRRLEGFDETLLYREHHLLRRSLWNLLRDRYGGSHEALDAMMRLDLAMVAAVAASLYGFHREPAGDDWIAARERLQADWPRDLD